MPKKKVPLLVLFALLLFALPSGATSYNSPECDISGALDCWRCKHIGFGNREFCWPLTGSEGATGWCGCVDFAPYGPCTPDGQFCGNIIVVP